DVVLLAASSEVSVGKGRERVWLFQRHLEQQHELIGIRIGKGSQKHGIHDAENGGVGADAESEREHGDGGEAGGFAEHAQGVAEVLRQIVNIVCAAHVAAFLFELFDAAEVQKSVAAGFGG